jgi:hypothetical protein
MTPTYTLTLKDTAATITAVMRYITPDSGYPQMPKNFTRLELANGNYAYEYSSNAVKRRWTLDIKGEDSSDLLLTNLKALYDLKESLLLDEDALLVVSNISVVFEEFQPINVSGTLYYYRVVLQEI